MRNGGPDGSIDDNVFDITIGVGIGLFVKSFGSKSGLHTADLWGSRTVKYGFLSHESPRTCRWIAVRLSPPEFFFALRDDLVASEYGAFEELSDMFHVFGNGVGTDRDDLFYDLDRKVLVDRIRRFFSSEGLTKTFIQEFGVRDSSSYPLLMRRSSSRFAEACVKNCLYRPFDCRWLYYDLAVTSRPAREVMRHFESENKALLITRQLSSREFRHVFVANRIIDRDPLSIATRERTQVFPLYQRVAKEALGFGESVISNLKGTFLLKLNSTFAKGLADQLKVFVAGPEDIFQYTYAVFHSPGYRTRYAEFLKIDFPRLPLTLSLNLFQELVRLGDELVALHLMESPKLNDSITTYTGPKSPEVGRVGWSDDTVWLDAAATKKGQPATPGTIGFRGVPEAVWNFHIGGYQVCEKWLKDRKGRTLSKEDIAHYQKIVVAISETIRIMKEIDEAIGKHGGWPGAFTVVSKDSTVNEATELKFQKETKELKAQVNSQQDSFFRKNESAG